MTGRHVPASIFLKAGATQDMLDASGSYCKPDDCKCIDPWGFGPGGNNKCVYAIKRCMAGVADWKYGLGSAESLGLAGHSTSDITNPAWWRAKGKKSPAAKKIIAEPKSKKGRGASKSGIQKSGGARRSSRLVAK